MKFLRRILLALSAAFLVTGTSGLLRAAEVIPPAPERYFNDYAGIVQPATADALNTELDQFERATSNQILVVIYPHMQSDSSVEDYAVRVAEAWGAGQKARSNGAVLFVFFQDHKVWIATGYGLEASLPDALCKRIIDGQITPAFKRGDYDGGLRDGVAAMIAATKGEYTGNGSTDADAQSGGGTGLWVPLAFLVLLVICSFFRSRQHVVYGGAGRRTFWGGPMIFPGGGGYRGGGGFGGGGGGGFSGGGGGFGGGGAGGSW